MHYYLIADIDPRRLQQPQEIFRLSVEWQVLDHAIFIKTIRREVAASSPVSYLTVTRQEVNRILIFSQLLHRFCIAHCEAELPFSVLCKITD